MKDPYTILGVSPDATDEEIKNAYRNLARKYHPDNYPDDNPLKDLAKDKMQQINAAYDEIQKARRSGANGGSGYNNGGSRYNSASGIYITIRQKIQARHFGEAESLLNSVPEYERTADWHYLSSLCLYRRQRFNDAMRELEIACNMDPSNQEYQQAKQMFNNTAKGYGSTYYGDTGGRRRSSDADACDCCMNLLCLDCCCECMGGDLIPCI